MPRNRKKALLRVPIWISKMPKPTFDLSRPYFHAGSGSDRTRSSRSIGDGGEMLCRKGALSEKSMRGNLVFEMYLNVTRPNTAASVETLVMP